LAEVTPAVTLDSVALLLLLALLAAVPFGATVEILP